VPRKKPEPIGNIHSSGDCCIAYFKVQEDVVPDSRLSDFLIVGSDQMRLAAAGGLASYGGNLIDSSRLTGTLPPSGGSRDPTKSPAKVSPKWEYWRIGPETFGELTDQNRKMGSWTLPAKARKPAIGGAFLAVPQWRPPEHRNGWLATQC
jgi:hypothetical protein